MAARGVLPRLMSTATPANASFAASAPATFSSTDLRLCEEAGLRTDLVQSLHARLRTIGVEIAGKWYWFAADGTLSQTQLGRFHFGYTPERYLRHTSAGKAWIMEQAIACVAADEDPDEGISAIEGEDFIRMLREADEYERARA